MTDSISYYKDILFVDGVFYANKEIIREVSLHNRFHVPFSPADILTLGHISDVHVYDTPILYIDGFHNNMGHLFWDCMYASWYGLYYYNEEASNRDFQWMAKTEMYNAYRAGWHEDVIETFSGNKILTPELLWNIYKKPIRISNFIVGCKGIGIGCVNESFTCGRQLRDHMTDPIECFVDRMYARYKVERPRYVSRDSMKIIYIVNKRPYNNILKLFVDLSKKYGPEYKFTIVDWSRYSMEQQLRILSSTAIIICGVGTARGNTPFLPHGAIEIQTNDHSVSLPNNIDFFDYHIGTLSKFIKVMNIPDYTVDEARGRLCSRYMEAYINEAISAIPNAYPIRVEDNIPDYIVKHIMPKVTQEIFKAWRSSNTNSVSLLHRWI